MTRGTLVRVMAHYRRGGLGEVLGPSTTWNELNDYLVVEFPDGVRAEYHPDELEIVPPLTQLAMALDED